MNFDNNMNNSDADLVETNTSSFETDIVPAESDSDSVGTCFDMIEEDIFKFAFMGTNDAFNKKLKILSDKAIPEVWNNKNSNPDEFPILKNYIIHTFKRLAFEYNNKLFSELGPSIYF